MKKGLFIVTCCLLLCNCYFNGLVAKPSIEFTKVPPASEGGPGEVLPIEGHVTGARKGDKVIIYAHSGVWWIQPKVSAQFTSINPDLTWKNFTHLGTEYAALLVKADYSPPAKLNDLPVIGDGVIAVAIMQGTPSPPPLVKKIQFSGYEWTVKSHNSDPGGTVNIFDPENVWTDEKGFLHLRITHNSGNWTSAEIRLARSLGYGTYKFVVQDTSHLEPAAVFSMFTWDDLEAEQNHREMNIDISRWGDPDSKNLQYVIQPHIVPANVVRFTVPSGTLTHTLRWEPGKAGFKSIEVNKSREIAAYNFITGVPVPGSESIHLNLYIFGRGKTTLQNDNEVIIEKFEYLP